MADDDRKDFDVWFFLLGLALGVVIVGGGTVGLFASRQARIGAEIRAAMAEADAAAVEAEQARREAEAARKVAGKP